MSIRWYPLAVIACWLATMGWLAVEKVLPTLSAGDPPALNDVLPEQQDNSKLVCWSIHYDDQQIGTASSLTTRHGEGGGRIQSVVQFDRLPLAKILSESLGSMGVLARTMITGGGLAEFSMTVESQMWVAADGRLDHFTVNAGSRDSTNFVEVRGQAEESQLHVEVYTPEYSLEDNTSEMQLKYRDNIRLPDEALVMGSLSPQTQLRGLRVGQKWTFPIYRPFPPDRPVQFVQAEAIETQPFVHDGETVTVTVVLLRDEAGSSLSVASEPIGKIWVMSDGTVLQQETQLANLKFRFRRLADDRCTPEFDLFTAKN